MASLKLALLTLVALHTASSCTYFCKDERTNSYICCDAGPPAAPAAPGGDGANAPGNSTNPGVPGNPGNSGTPGNPGIPGGGDETDPSSNGGVHTVVVTEYGPEDGARYNTSSGCVYYCAYGGSVYCCDDGSLTSESPDDGLDLLDLPDLPDLLDLPDLPPGLLRPAKVKKKSSTQLKKKAYKSKQAVKESIKLKTEDVPSSKRVVRFKRDVTDDALSAVEVSERSSRSRKSPKNSAWRRNYQEAPRQSLFSRFSSPFMSSFPFSRAESSKPNLEIEKITVNMSSLPVLPARRQPFHRAPLHSPFLPSHGQPNSLPHGPLNGEFLEPNPFRYGALNNLNDPFGFVNGKESGDGLNIGEIPVSGNHSQAFPGSPGGNLLGNPFPAPFGPGPYAPGPFGPGPFGPAPFGPSPIDHGPFGPTPFGHGPFGPSSFSPKLDFPHLSQMPFSPLQSHLQGLYNNETIEKSFSTHSLPTPTSSLFSPFGVSGGLASPQGGIIVEIDDSITKAISPQLQPPTPNLRFRRHPEIATQAFPPLIGLGSLGTHLPSISSGLAPFGPSVSSFGANLPSFSSSLSSFSSGPGLTFSPSISSSGLSFQNGLVHPIHEVHPLLRSSFGLTPLSVSNKNNFGSFQVSPSTPLSSNNLGPLDLQNTARSSQSSSGGDTHFKTSGFSSQLKGDTVILQPPPTSPSTGSISPPSPVRPPSTEGSFRSHTKVISHPGHPPHEGPTGRHIRDHADHGHHNHVHHDHHDPAHLNHQKSLHHNHAPVHQGQPHQIHQHHSPGHSTRTESFSYIDAEGNHHIHFRGAPPTLPHPPQPSPSLPHPPLFPSSSIPSHLPPHPPPLSTHIRPPSAVLPLEKHHSTPELPAHPPLNLLPPSPPRLNREINPVPVLPFQNSVEVFSNAVNDRSPTEVVLNIGEVRSRYKGIQEITLNIGESLPAISDVEIDEHESGRKTLTVSMPSKKSVDKIPPPKIEVPVSLKTNEKTADTNEKRDINVTTEAAPKTSAHKRPLSFPEDIPFFEKGNFDPVLIGDQIIQETDAPKFVRDAGFAPFRPETSSPSSSAGFAFSSLGPGSSQPPLYYPKSQVTPRPRLAPLQDSTKQAFNNFMTEKNLDFAFNDLFGEAPVSVQSHLSAFESSPPEEENPFHLIEHAKPKSIAEQIVLLEKICPCLARPTAFHDREHCRCPAADRVAVAYRRTRREPYVVMTYKHFLIDRLALELEANLRLQTGINTPRLRRPLKSKAPPSSDWTPMLVPGSAAFDTRDNRHIEDLFLISIPETHSDGRKVRDGHAHSSLDSKGLAAIKNAIEEFVKTVEGHDVRAV